MANVKFVAVSRGLKSALSYVMDQEKTVDRLITGVNCVAQTALDEFEAVKKQFRKTDGRSYYHIVQAFAPDDPVDFDTAHEIGLKFAEYFQGHQCMVVTHMNTQHIHNHIVMNSVNYETGRKFHQSAKEMKQAKEFNNQLCLQYGLSITETKADRNQIPKWKKKLRDNIKRSMKQSRSQQEFISQMKKLGYQVKWEADHKHITYTTPENYHCRDNKLFDSTLLRENMELYFEMGGCEYLESCIDRCEYGEPIPSIDDVVCELASILDSIIAGDTHRFHLETVHHSKKEILMMLRKGKKIQRTKRVVDDGPEYEQYHGFSMMM